MEHKINEIYDEVLRDKGVLEELLWSNIFRDTIVGSRWLVNQAFSPGRAAIGYPALYALYRILDEFQPESILEMGLGQSTKMIGAYAAWKYSSGDKCNHYIVEHDESWIEFFTKNNKLSDATSVVQLDLASTKVTMEGGEYTYMNAYVGVKERFGTKKFDLIFIDGPFGSPIYSRTDILDLLPECLGENWIIMLDDAQRVGEQNTLVMIRSILQENDIDYSMNYYRGEKATAILTSKSLHFLCTM